jgi:general secretion pathway protein G
MPARPILDYATPFIRPPRLYDFTFVFRFLVITLFVTVVTALIAPRSTSHCYERVAGAQMDIANLETALDTFWVDAGRLPTRSEGLAALVVRPPGLHNWHGPYIKRGVPNDPWDNPYLYDPDRGAITGEHSVSSAGPDGIAGTADDITASP